MTPKELIAEARAKLANITSGEWMISRANHYGLDVFVSPDEPNADISGRLIARVSDTTGRGEADAMLFMNASSLIKQLVDALEASLKEDAQLKEEIAIAREACPIVRRQDYFDASLLTAVNETVSQLFQMQSRAEKAERRVQELEHRTEWLCGPCNTVHPTQQAGKMSQPCPECGELMTPTSPSLREMVQMKQRIQELEQDVSQHFGQRVKAELRADNAEAKLRDAWEADVVKRQVADFNNLCDAARRYREHRDLLREALVKIIGPSERHELERMVDVIDRMHVSHQYKDATLHAIHALIATAPEGEKK